MRLILFYLCSAISMSVFSDTTAKVTDSITLSMAQENGVLFNSAGSELSFNFTEFSECTVESVHLQTTDKADKIQLHAQLPEVNSWYKFEVFSENEVNWRLSLGCKFGGRGIYMVIFIYPDKNKHLI